MKRFSFESGVHVVVAGTDYLIVAPSLDHEGFTLLDQATGQSRDYCLDELHGMLERGELRYQPPASCRNEIVATARAARSITTMSTSERRRIDFKMAVLRAVDLLEPGTKFEEVTKFDPGLKLNLTAPRLLHTIREACRAAGRKEVTTATYYNWRRAYGRHADASDLRDRYRDRGRRPYLDAEQERLLKEAISTAVELAKARKKTGLLHRVTPKAIMSRMADAVPGSTRLPSRTKVTDAINALPAFDLAVAKRGLRWAENEFRSAGHVERPEACLERVEYDEARLPFIIVDEAFGVALGFPYLSWYLDVTSVAPLGFYVGFEPMSDVSTMAALRHSCLPKTYMSTEYPEINGGMVAGVPRGIVYDNGLSQHGDTIQAAATDIGFDYKYAPPYTPWFKSAVENMHKTLNDTLLEALPGFCLSPSQRPSDYDPSRSACIGLRHFLLILHHWIAERYMLAPTGAFSLRPIDRWKAGTAKVKPTFLASVDDLDLVFGILRSGRIDHRGIRFENLWYRSHEMAALRRRFGAALDIRIKANPADIGTIRWQAPDGAWRLAQADCIDYARGRGLYQHKLIQRCARERFGGDEVEALRAADSDLRLLGRQALAMSLGLRSNAQVARAMGVGTEHLFNAHGHDGGVTGLAGPYAGTRLNPFTDGDGLEGHPVKTPTSSGVNPTILPQRHFKVERRGDG